MKIVDGRKFERGMRELVVGTGAQRQFAGLDAGQRRSASATSRGRWSACSHSGDAMESELWGDAQIVADTYRRGSSRASVTAKLDRRQGVQAASRPRWRATRA